jgi:hypothetical protein
MDRRCETQVEINAAKSLASWASDFVDGVRKQAKQLAAQSGQPQLITASQYRQAALSALQSLSKSIEGEVDRDGNRTASQHSGPSRWSVSIGKAGPTKKSCWPISKN